MHHKIHISCITKSCIARVFYPHLHFPRSCCSQCLTLQSKSNLLGTYQNRCQSVCLFLLQCHSWLSVFFYSSVIPGCLYISTPVPFLDVCIFLLQCHSWMSVFFYSSAIPGCLSIFTPVSFLDALFHPSSKTIIG